MAITHMGYQVELPTPAHKIFGAFVQEAPVDPETVTIECHVYRKSCSVLVVLRVGCSHRNFPAELFVALLALPCLCIPGARSVQR